MQRAVGAPRHAANLILDQCEVVELEACGGGVDGKDGKCQEPPAGHLGGQACRQLGRYQHGGRSYGRSKRPILQESSLYLSEIITTCQRAVKIIRKHIILNSRDIISQKILKNS